MNNYSTLPYGNNVGAPPPRERHHSTSSNNSAYGTITKASTGRLNYLANNYDSGHSTSAYEEDPEWCYPPPHPRNLILGNNLQSASPAPSDQTTFTSGVSLNHSNIPPHAIYVQNTNTVAISRQSPFHNGSLLRPSPNPSAQFVTASNLQQNVVKQLQEKFGGEGVLNNGGQVNNGGQDHNAPNILSDVELPMSDQSSMQRRLKNNDNKVNILGGQNIYSGTDNNGGFSPLSAEPPGLTYNSGKSESNIGFGVGGQLREVRTVNFGENSTNDADSRGGTYFKSAWIHCRLPLLILVVVLLLVLFLSFSGALIYFKYVPYESSAPSFEDEACSSVSCAFGADCVLEGGRGVCRCAETCSTNYDPICGTDGLTYSNLCLLRIFACQNQNSIRIRHEGQCDLPDPCSDKRCLFGSRCVVSDDGHYATCECPTNCPSFIDSGDLLPVCGSDGRFYRSRCEMDRVACGQHRNISVKFYGPCDPCETMHCAAPQICQLDSDRRPLCRCGEMCSADFNPVCGSDGKTYSNECIMRQEACRNRKDLRIIYRGKCSSGTNPCTSRTCRGYESCAINKFGIAKCNCAMKCDPVVAPVCGTDGKTYDSHCDLTLLACRDSRQVAVAYKGPCEPASLCAKHSCSPGATCTERNNEAICECPACPSDYDPVCGSDGVSYQNECRLRMESCLTQNENIHKLYTGLCNLIRDFNPYDGCDRKQCDFYAVCASDPQTTETKCVCPTNCTKETGLSSSTVCGTDGRTYSHECELRRVACQLQKVIFVASKGHCDLCANVECKFGARCSNGVCECPTDCPPNKEPVCGSNLMTYANECELQKTACQLGRPLNVHFYGECAEGINPPINFGGPSNSQVSGPSSVPSIGSASSSGLATEVATGKSGGKDKSAEFGMGGEEQPKMCESIRCDFGAMCELGLDGFPRCSCQFNCSVAPGNPVCGSDLKLYVNDCEMRREGCHRQTELRPRPMELCEEMEARPCNGEDPLKHPGSGEEINCGSGPTRTNCPNASYCHKSSTFAKCCKKPEERTTTRKPQPKPQPKCEDSMHGCCPDGVTSAMGEEHAGCPSVCKCNKLGSIAETCDPFTHECQCRPGVGTPKCDRCLPGFWGLSRIALEGHLGCRECGCSKFGSVRDDCEQMTGRCVCKPGVLGHKCDYCADGEFLGPYGCTIDPINLGRTCDEVVCGYRAECEQDGNRAGCVCNMFCADTNDNEEICASDGFTYESDCLVRLQSCRIQKPIWVAHKGPCLDSSESDGTESPIRRWTGLHYTEPGDDGMSLIGLSESARSNSEIWVDQMGAGLSSSGMKSTRHLPPISKYHETHNHNHQGHRSPTAATIQMKSYLGDVCGTSQDCLTEFSICLAGWCICREGFYEDAERVQCKPIHSHLSGELSCRKSQDLCDSPSSCVDHFNGTFSCLCPLGLGQQTCSVPEPSLPFLSGRSSVSVGKLAGYHKLSLELEITPFLNFAHGMLIFSSQHGNGSGDFLSLALIDGFVEFRYDLGDGPAILRSATRVNSGTTYHIVAKRYNRDGLLRVDGDEEIKGTSPGTMKSLNLEHGSYLGFVPLNTTKIWELVGTSEGFVGCVHKLKVGRRPIEFSDQDSFVSSMVGVSQCPNPALSPHRLTTTPMYTSLEAEEETSGEGPTSLSSSTGSESHADNQPITFCSLRNPCHNHGHCWDDKGTANGYRCVCHPHYTGKHCESRTSNLVESGAMLDFRGSYLEFAKIENAAKQVSIELWLMVRSRNGLVLYNGQDANGKGDFIAIFFSNGLLTFLFDLGSGVANLTWPQPITMNKWHWISVSREGREGKLQVDGHLPVIGKSPPSLSELNLELPLFFGGVENWGMLHREVVAKPFDGALQYIRVNGETYHRQISKALEDRVVHGYQGPPCGSSVSPPCNNGGTCLPRLDSFVCICPPQFSGNICDGHKEDPGPIRFTGHNFLEFPRKIGAQSINFTDYDDFYNDHFDSKLDELFGEEPLEKDKLNADAHEESDFITTVESDEFIPLLEEDFVERSTAQLRNRVEIVFRTRSETPGLVLWTGQHFHGTKQENESTATSGYLGFFIVDGFPELIINLDAAKNKKPLIIRSKVQVNDNRWHQILIARRRRSIVFQVDGSTPRRATAPSNGGVLVTNGRYWIGGVPGSVLPSEIPPSYHQGFIGCVDLVRIEKRRLPLTKIAYANEIPFCEDET